MLKCLTASVAAAEKTVVFLTVFSAISSPSATVERFVLSDSQFILIICLITVETYTYFLNVMRHRGDFVGQDSQFILFFPPGQLHYFPPRRGKIRK